MFDLTKLQAAVIIFEIDDTSFRGHARFMRLLDEARALSDIKNDVEQGWGGWEGKTSPCYVMDYIDYAAIQSRIIPLIINQDAVMVIGILGQAVIVNSIGTEIDEGEVIKVKTDELSTYKGYTLLRSGAYVLDGEANDGKMYPVQYSF
ncbi:hypothetical protein BD1_47 [Octadecabacter Antarctic BD virus 1]|nr:hypothetical protein BD1_47 [Octadecabacter Antarctic BD virus 1]